MKCISISESGYNENNIIYLQNTLSELFSHTDCTVKNESLGKRVALKVSCPEYYADIVRAEISDKAAEIVAIKYKYNYFKETVKVAGLSGTEYEILLASLIAADLDDDKKYSFDRFKTLSEIAVDGVYNFRLKPLKRKWADVASYMPSVFINTQLKDFVTYLLENRKKRAYVECGRVYDCHYRRLKRCTLLDGEEAQIVREILLSGSGEVEINGTIPKEDETYLKQFYGDKIYFSSGYLS